MTSKSLIPGADHPTSQPEDIRRAWLRRRVAASTEAVDALIALALGDLPDDLQAWPILNKAEMSMEVAHA